MPTVQVVSLGTSHTRVALDSVAEAANRAQNYYSFSVADPLERIGEPDRHSEDLAALPADQYSAEHLALRLVQERGSPAVDFLVGVVDALVFDELFSVVDEANAAILISVRGNDLDHILSRSGKSAEEYVLLELTAQLLTLEVRRRTESRVSSTDCGVPWHRERRGCLFDYYGLARDDVDKIIAPRLCTSCTAFLTESGVPESAIEAALGILGWGLKPRLWIAAKQTVLTPVATLLIGAWLGATLSTLFIHGRWLVAFSTLIGVGVSYAVVRKWWRLRKLLAGAVS